MWWREHNILGVASHCPLVTWHLLQSWACCELISIQAPCQHHCARQSQPLEAACGEPARVPCTRMPAPHLRESVFTFLPLSWPAAAKQAAGEAWHHCLALVPVPSWHWLMPAGTGTVPSMPPWLCQAIPLQWQPEDAWTFQVVIKTNAKYTGGGWPFPYCFLSPSSCGFLGQP